jgi:hypothetical protein
MSHDLAPYSLDGSAGFSAQEAAALGHAEGMKAISRRLSAAIPPESNTKHIASQRDASTYRMQKYMRLLLPSLRDGAFLGRMPVVSLVLNHRIIATLPAASDPAP